MTDMTAKLNERINEIKKLYDISEAEFQCMIQMSMMIRMLGYTPELSTKLLRALSAINEIILDDMKVEENKK